jgi:hypothetical protein
MYQTKRRLIPANSKIMFSRNTERRKMNKKCRIKVYTAVNMKNAVFWDIKTQFVLHRRHITSPLQRSAG